MTERLLFLDTETTGIEPRVDRVIDIGVVAVVNGEINTAHAYQTYLNPERTRISRESHGVHGLSEAFLEGQPLFADVIDALYTFIEGQKVLVHNARFDVGMLNAEVVRLNAKGGRYKFIEEMCQVCDTVEWARSFEHKAGLRAGNFSLDALCKIARPQSGLVFK